MVVTLQPRIHRELQRINKTYGLLTPFLAKHGLNYRTFQRLVRDGAGRMEHVDKVTAAINLPPIDVTVTKIIHAIAVDFDLTVSELTNPKHKDNIPKQLTAWMARKETSQSLNSIAQACGYANHTSVISASKAIDAEMDSNRDFRKRVYGLLAKISQGQ